MHRRQFGRGRAYNLLDVVAHLIHVDAYLLKVCTDVSKEVCTHINLDHLVPKFSSLRGAARNLLNVSPSADDEARALPPPRLGLPFFSPNLSPKSPTCS